MSLSRIAAAALLTLSLAPAAVAQTPAAVTAPSGAAPATDARPLSPAQVALFMTPHLRNVDHPETLHYRFVRTGIDPFTDQVAVHVRDIHPDGTRYVTFDYLTGLHHVPLPAADGFTGNPLLMLWLDQDVIEMRQSLGVAASWFRNRVRESMVDRAQVRDTTFTLDGHPVPAREITLHPFATEERLERLPSVQAKEYTFVLADAVPGSIAELRIAMPADPAKQIPAVSETLTFTGVSP